MRNVAGSINIHHTPVTYCTIHNTIVKIKSMNRSLPTIYVSTRVNLKEFESYFFFSMVP